MPSRRKKVTISYVERATKDSQGIYCRITYDKKATMFKAGTKTGYFDAQSEERIRELVYAEEELRGEKFDLKGFGDRLDFYESGALKAFLPVMEGKLLKQLETQLTYKEYTDLTKASPSKDQYKEEYGVYFKIPFYLWFIENQLGRSVSTLFDQELQQLLRAYLQFVHFDNEKLRQSSSKESPGGGISMGDWLMSASKVKRDYEDFLARKLQGKAKPLAGADKGFFSGIERQFPFTSSDLPGMVDLIGKLFTEVFDYQVIRPFAL